jgi:hypothetical protein
MNEYDPILDEIVSAYVDGEATPAERARVESDPALLERVATFRQLHDAIASPPRPVDDERRRHLVAHALAEAPAPLAPVRSMRTRRFSAVAPIAAAAAIIAAVLGLGTWLVSTQENRDSDMATSAAPDALRGRDQAESDAGAAESSSMDATKSQGAVTTRASASAPAAASATPFLGRFADEAALRQALTERSSAPSTTIAAAAAGAGTTTGPTSGASSCGVADTAGATRYAAELRSRPVTVVVTGTRAEVIDDITCARTTLDLSNR